MTKRNASDFDYQAYLASREWALLKRAVRERAGGVCERCHDRPISATHHLTYERVGHEQLEDLLGVCGPCHDYLSGRIDEDPALTATQIAERDFFKYRFDIFVAILLDEDLDARIPADWQTDFLILTALTGFANARAGMRDRIDKELELLSLERREAALDRLTFMTRVKDQYMKQTQQRG